ncbi:MAG: ABC transporter substrate-binding protein [Candidatus Margulisbacteria bacterium]|nr:ABC transporter substrate-binding protein [Candidatus Margulisiibacteriota bacterium]
MSHILKHVLILVLFLSLSVKIFAESSNRTLAPKNTTENAKLFLQQHINDIFKTLRDDSLNIADKKQVLAPILRKLVNFQLISKLIIGRTHWKQLSTEERSRFGIAFEKHLLDSYLSKLILFSNEKLYLDKAQKAKGKVSIIGRIITKKDTLSITFKLYFPKKWQLYDIEVEGVSILQSYQAQFRPLLKSKSIDAIIHNLKQVPAET